MNSLSVTQIAKPTGNRIAGWPEWFVVFAGGLLAFDGAAKLLAVLEKSQQLYLSDPLTGIQFRYLFIGIGIVEVLVACLCLFTTKRNTSLGLAAWLVINFLTYRIGLWAMGWPHPYVFLESVMKISYTSPLIADGIVSLFSFILLGGSATWLWFGNRNPWDFIKIPCPSCGGRVKFATQNLGQRIPCPHCQQNVTLRRADENLKMPCFFCKGRIEFPAHALGQKLQCPHCAMDITLKEPATS